MTGDPPHQSRPGETEQSAGKRVTAAARPEPTDRNPTRVSLTIVLREIGWGVIRIPFLCLFLWLLLFIFGVLAIVLQPVIETLPAGWPQAAAGIAIRFGCGLGAGGFVGYHYRHWQVYAAALLLAYPWHATMGPATAVGIIAGYSLAPRIFRQP